MQNKNNKKSNNSKKNGTSHELKPYLNKRYQLVTKETIPELPKDEVLIAKLRKVKDPKTTSDARKIQFLETMTINDYDFDLTLIALRLDLLVLQEWFASDKYFRNLAKRYLCAFREIVKMRMLHGVHKDGYKLRDCEFLLNRLPEFAEEQEAQENAWVAIIPFILSEDADMVDGTIPLAPGKKIVKREIPL